MIGPGVGDGSGISSSTFVSSKMGSSVKVPNFCSFSFAKTSSNFSNWSGLALRGSSTNSLSFLPASRLNSSISISVGSKEIYFFFSSSSNLTNICKNEREIIGSIPPEKSAKNLL